MSYTVKHFNTLRERFPIWDELKAHLESAGGGKLSIREPAEGAGPYAVIRYVKGESSVGLPELGTGLFRSVVWDTVKNVPVCMAPQKAREGAPPVGTPFTAVEDFLDGFMLNAFLVDDELLIATRTLLGGENKFYSEKSFAAMFDEALANTPLKDRAGLKAALAEVAKFGGGASRFASFVVQHPEHRVVSKCPAAALYVVQVGVAHDSGHVEVWDKPTGGGAWPAAFLRLQVQSYLVTQFASEEEAQELLRRTGVQRGWRWQGLIFKDGTGARWRLRTPTYKLLRGLRGSEATGVERFLRLRSEGKVTEYLKHYSEDREAFWDMEQKLRARTQDAFYAYQVVHKAHELKFGELPDAYKPIVFRMHLKYLEELRAEKHTVRLGTAIEVVNGLKAYEQRRLLEAEPFEHEAKSVEEEAAAEEAVAAE